MRTVDIDFVTELLTVNLLRFKLRFHHPFQFPVFQLSVKAGIIPFVACGTDLLDIVNERIAIAIDPNPAHALEVTRALAL